MLVRVARGLVQIAATFVIVAALAPARAQGAPAVIFTSNDQSGKLACGSTWSDVYRLQGGVVTRLTNAIQQMPDAEAFCQIGYVRPMLSPDGTRIAAMRYEGTSTAIIVMNADGSDHRVVTHQGEGHPLGASWSPDGKRLVHDGHDVPGLKLVNVDGSGSSIIPNTQFYRHPAWSPDGAWIAFSFTPEGEQVESIGVIRPDGSGFRRVSGDSDLTATHAAWSPDGTLIAYATEEQRCGGNLLAVVPFEGGAPEFVPTPDDMCSAGSPSWLTNDRLIFWGAIGTAASDVYTIGRNDGASLVRLTQTRGAELDPSGPPGGITGDVTPAVPGATPTTTGPPLGAEREDGGSSLPLVLAVAAVVLVAGYVVARKTVFAKARAERDRRPSDHTACRGRWENAERASSAARNDAARQLGDSLASLSSEWHGLVASLEEARAAFERLDGARPSEPAPDDEDALVRKLLDGIASEIVEGGGR
jgi:hypothetical protein